MDERESATALTRMIFGFHRSQALHVVATLGVADLLKDGPRSSEELALETGAHPEALYRVLRALAAEGVFDEQEGRRFALTPLGEHLRSDAALSLGPLATYVGQSYHWETWGRLLHGVRTGKTVFSDLHGKSVWQHRAEHPEESAVFDRAMAGISRSVGDAVVEAYDFRPFRTIVDVAGGHGALLTRILNAHRHARGILFDQPHVVARAGEVLRAAGVAERCDIVGGDFFTSVPEGADAYVLKWIIHDWDDAESFAILKNCRRAMGTDARLLLVETVLAPPNQGTAAKFMDLNMMVMLGGKERTEDEFAALLAEAGFRLSKVVPTAAMFCVIEGVPV